VHRGPEPDPSFQHGVSGTWPDQSSGNLAFAVAGPLGVFALGRPTGPGGAAIAVVETSDQGTGQGFHGRAGPCSGAIVILSGIGRCRRS
jgi:hypothetical protein